MTEDLKVAKKDDVWHLVKRGMLMQLHFDMETFGLDRDFAQFMSYGDALGDIAGNMTDSQELQIKRPDRYLASVPALLKTRTSPAELDAEDREPHRIAMAKIGQRFEKGAHGLFDLPLDEIDVEFETVRRMGKDEYKKACSETVLDYPLKGANGETLHDVRYHPDRKMIAYRFDTDPASPYYQNVKNNYYIDKDGSHWKFVEPRLLVSGYRIKWADITWLRANLVKAGFHPSNIFFTHSRATITNKQKPKNYAVDAYSIVQAVHAFGPQGENGLKLSDKVDERTGQKVVSASLSRVMEANTHYASDTRGIHQGVLMPDNTQYTTPRAHRSPAYDAQASFAIYNYARSIDPSIVRSSEIQSDEKELRRLLPGLDVSAPPIFGMRRNSNPMTYPLHDPVTFLGFDDQLGKLGKAIMVRLNENLRTYKYNNKTLSEMTGEDFARMIQEQNRKPDSLIRPEPIRKWSGVVQLEDALKGGGAGDLWDFEQIDDNFRFLIENPSICEAIRSGVEIVNWDIKHHAEPANAMMEEEWTHNGFGDLDYLEDSYPGVGSSHDKGLKKRGGHGEIPAVVETIYNKAMDIYNYHRTMDAVLHTIALQPHPIDYSNSAEDVENYIDLLRRAKQKLSEKDSPYKAVLSRYRNLKDMSPERARAIRWELMKRYLDDDQKERETPGSRYAQGYFEYKDTVNKRALFANLSRNFRIVDQNDRELTIDYIKRQFANNPHDVQKFIEKGIWRIQFYRLSSEPSITATLFQFADMGKLKELPAVWQKRYEGLKRRYLNGASNEDPSRMRWPSIPRIEYEIKKLEVNAKTGNREGIARIFSEYAQGDGDNYVTEDESQRILGEYPAYLEKIRKENPMTEAFMRATQYDPASGLPYDWINKEIPSRKMVVIEVPDAHLRAPLEDIRTAPYALVINKLTSEEKKKIKDGATVVLRGQQTGRVYYPGPVDIVPAPSKDNGFQMFYEKAESAYEQDAGVAFPKAAQRSVLIMQKPVPVAQTRRTMDMSLQGVKVPSQFFDALVAPRLGHFDQKKSLTGLALPVDYCPQKLEVGKGIRFREMAVPMGAKLAGNESADTGHIYESTLNDVRRTKVSELQTLISDDQAERYGFASAYDMYQKIRNTFQDQESQNPDQEEVFLMEFAKVNKKTWAYFNPPKAPEAAVTYNGKPVPPSAYRSMLAVNNNAPDAVAAPAVAPR